MTSGRLSVVVVSRHRAEALRRCVVALRQQIGATIELVVVADPAGCAAIDAPDLCAIVFDRANISQARNLGLARTTAEIVAFLDDDAVPEPTWAARLMAASQMAGAVSATGYVLGRNGISYQWRAAEVDGMGQDHPLDLPGDGPYVLTGSPGRAIKTQGTNCAFDAEKLRAIGGFDPCFRFFPYEPDVHLRLSLPGPTVVPPPALVLHAFLASARRNAARVPLSLHEIAASTAVFLRKHAAAQIAEGRDALWHEQSARLRHLRRRLRLNRAGESRLLETLAAGWADGLARPISDLRPVLPAGDALRPLETTASGAGRVISGWSWQEADLRAEALRARAKGEIVSLLCLSPGVRRHWQVFVPAGSWVETGGVWGRTVRDRPPPLGQGIAACHAAYIARISPFRPTASAG